MSVTLTAKLVNVLGVGNTGEQGSITIALCGYGSRVPIVPGGGTFGRVTSFDVEADPVGNVTADVWGNDKILPAGTYYTVTVKDSNGDVMQVNAYIFIDGNNYDLDNTIPYDPSQPPSPLPPLIIPQLLVVAYGPTPNFPGDQYTAFQITLSGDAAATLSNIVPGNLYTFIIIQDGAGGHHFTWPANVHNGAAVNPEASATTVQTFVAEENGDLTAIGPGMWA